MKPIRAALSFAALLALAACGTGEQMQPAEPSAKATQTSSLERAFERAAYEYQVPVGLLKAIAYVETRVSHSTQPSLAGGHGVMQLVEREDWSPLTRAAALTGQDVSRLKLDPEANILGAAAVLRELADKSFASYGDLNPSDPADFWHAVSLYAGLSSATMGTAYARDVYMALEDGFTVDNADGAVSLAPTYTSWRRHLPAVESRSDLVKEYPGAAQWIASPNYTAGRSSYLNVLIHTTQGSYAGTVSWFQNTASNVSSHYVVRSSDGQITQMVEHKNTAWHAQCYNARSVGIEHEGFVADPAKWYTEAMYNASAKLTRWIADRHGIPRDRSHIIGHREVPSNCNTGGHTDPGTGWNWTKYMGLVNGTTSTPTSGKLTGAIYQKGNTNDRVAGAVVTVAGKSVTTGTDGLYEFVLAPGTYTASVAKAGYSSNSVSRVVTAGTTIWGSMEINTTAAAGNLKGKIFEYNPANPTDMTKAITGATVSAGGKTVVTAADGMYDFSLAPGTYTVTVTKAGWANNSVTRTVTASAVIWGSVGLSTTGTADMQAPALNIAFPLDKASTDVAVLTLTGTASDNAGAVATVMLKLNGGAAQAVPVAAGKFSQQIKLGPGANILEISATDAAGNVGKDTATVTFNAGVSGFVHLVEDEASRVKNATIQLLDPATGDQIATATAGADGAFALNVMKVNTDFILVAKAPGFMTHSETFTIPDDERLSVKLPLTPGEDGTPDQFAINFMEPVDGSTVTAESVTVYGTVVGFEVASVTVNGQAAELIGAGGFSSTVSLVAGANLIEAVAKGTKGETLTAKMTVNRAGAGNIPGNGDGNQQKTGCAALPGLELAALAALLPLLRRRRR